MKATARLIPAYSSCLFSDLSVGYATRKASPPATVLRSVLALGLTLFATSTPAQNAWQSLERLPDRPSNEVWVRAQRFQAVALDHAALRSALDRAPQEAAQPVLSSAAEILLPMPDGAMARFRFVESPVMAPKLAAKFPEIKTYLGQGIDDPAATVRFDVTPAGFHAQILSPHGAV